MAVETMDPAQEFEAKILARMKPLNELTAHGTSAVQQFYSGTTVFLTGGSGYLGKQLIEKLLRATTVSKIFFLLRSKKGKSIEQRLNEMLQDPGEQIVLQPSGNRLHSSLYGTVGFPPKSPWKIKVVSSEQRPLTYRRNKLYNLLREQQPTFAKKLMPVSGDVSELRLGMSEKDWNTITEQVDIIFHLAATTRFDEPLRVATMINIRGTRETLLLGKVCKKLKSFIYVSTAFSHACVDRINKEVSEKFYKSPINPNTMIEIAETVDEERINDITPNLIKNWPNTYTFTKSVAEEVVNNIGNDLPICVVRPAVVLSSKLEPNPGWVDLSCMYGACGLITAIGLGVVHAVNVDEKCHTELIPVDYVNNALIAAGWETHRKRAAGENETKIYSLCSSSRNPVTWRDWHVGMRNEGRNYTTPMIVGYGFVLCTKNSILFWIYSWLLHIIPANIIDGISVMIGKKRRFAKLATKMYRMSSALSYFMCNQWQFDDKNTAALYNSLSKEDRDIFNFDVKDIDWPVYILTVIIGIRKYIVKDGLTGTLSARKKQTVLGLITLIVLPLYLYSLFRLFCLTLSVFKLI